MRALSDKLLPETDVLLPVKEEELPAKVPKGVKEPEKKRGERNFPIDLNRLLPGWLSSLLRGKSPDKYTKGRPHKSETQDTLLSSDVEAAIPVHETTPGTFSFSRDKT